MTQIYNWVGGGGMVGFILIGEELRLVHVEVENSKFFSVNGDFLLNTIDVSLAPYHYHGILRYLRIQSLDLADIRSHPILFVCLRYLQVSKTTEKKWRHHYRSDLLTNHNVCKFIARHSFIFVSIRTVHEVLRI